ncbi:hypothetical protein J4413_03925 [Candidatus Woesearchaeota archaeon]|nr:hypothetical protein [Candidatus Woesearchaeota archaeon]
MGFTAYTLEHYNKSMELKKNGLGSLRISKILNIKSRNAVEGWINKGRKPYYFSESRIKACNSNENIERMRKMNKITQPKAVKISAMLRTKKLPSSANVLDTDLAYILGVVYGDGHVSLKQRRVILSATDLDFVETFRQTLSKWSNFKVRFYSRNIRKPSYIKSRKLQWVAYIDSIDAAKLLSKFSLNKLMDSETNIKSSFLRGFFDSEGCVDCKGALSVYNKDFNLIKFVQRLLNSLEIQTNFHSYYGYTPDKSKKFKQHSLVVISKSKKRFKNLIGFNIQRKQIRLLQHAH